MCDEKMTSFEDEVLTKLTILAENLSTLEKQVNHLGRACSEAFQQVKTVIEHLTEAVDGTRQDLSVYGGTITGSTWDPFNY